MAIVYQGDQGLIQGINQAGSILGGVLMQKAQERTLRNQFTNINKKIEGKQFTPTLLQEILGEPGGMQYLQQFGPIIAPVLKEQAKSQGANAHFGNLVSGLFPDLAGGPSGAAQGAPGNPAQDLAPQVSPIAEANLIQGSNAAGTNASLANSAAEIASAQSNMPSDSGIPNTPPVADSNRVGPQEQTVYQQGGQAGMGLNPPGENGDAVRQQLQQAAAAQPNNVPANSPQQGFDISKLTPEQKEKLSLALAASPYSQHRELAKVLNDQAKTLRGEDQEIRKESRAEIAKYSEPYRDLNMIDSSVSKLEKAKELIQNRKVSLDQNQFRRLATAILEDEDFSAVAQYFKSDDQKMLFALLKDYFKTKDIGGSNPSTKEVLLSLSTLPSENLGQEANIALINELLKDAKGRQIKGKAISELRASGKQYNFGEFQKVIEDQVAQGVKPLEQEYSKDLIKAQYAKQIGGKKPNAGYVWVVDKDGNLGQIPKQNLKKFEDAGGIILNGK